jgi:hypothetical protein
MMMHLPEMAVNRPDWRQWVDHLRLPVRPMPKDPGATRVLAFGCEA